MPGAPPEPVPPLCMVQEEAPALVLQGLAAKLGPTFVKLAQTLRCAPWGHARACGWHPEAQWDAPVQHQPRTMLYKPPCPLLPCPPSPPAPRSMRPDLIGEGYAAALSELQDNVPPFDTATAFGILEAELGAPVATVFSSITPQPIASASLGQVGAVVGWVGVGRVIGAACVPASTCPRAVAHPPPASHATPARSTAPRWLATGRRWR